MKESPLTGVFAGAVALWVLSLVTTASIGRAELVIFFVVGVVALPVIAKLFAGLDKL